MVDTFYGHFISISPKAKHTNMIITACAFYNSGDYYNAHNICALLTNPETLSQVMDLHMLGKHLSNQWQYVAVCGTSRSLVGH